MTTRPTLEANKAVNSTLASSEWNTDVLQQGNWTQEVLLGTNSDKVPGTAMANPLSLPGALKVGDGANAPTYGLHVLGGGSRLQALATPGAPTVTPQGTTGGTTYTYYVVAIDDQGNKTVASAAGTTTTGNATLNGSNYNQISWAAVTGAVKYDVLKTNTSTSLATNVTGTSVNDTGQSTSAYTAPTRNGTADAIVDGALTLNKLSGFAPPSASGYGGGLLLTLVSGTKDADTYGLGIDASTLWANVSAGASYKWYVGAALAAQLTGSQLSINGHGARPTSYGHASISITLAAGAVSTQQSTTLADNWVANANAIVGCCNGNLVVIGITTSGQTIFYQLANPTSAGVTVTNMDVWFVGVIA